MVLVLVPVNRSIISVIMGLVSPLKVMLEHIYVWETNALASCPFVVIVL